MARKIKKVKVNKEKIENNIENQKKEEEEIKPFSIQSALAIFGSCLIGSWLFPVILSLLGVKSNLAVVIGNTFITSFGFVWTRNFIDSKRGYSKKFWQEYFVWAVIFGGISYFWLFRKSYI